VAGILRQIFGKYFSLFSKSKFVLLINITDKLYSFLILLLIAREFSSDRYGEVITLFTLAMIMQIVFDLGLPAYLQREIASGFSSESEIFSLSFSFTLLLFPVFLGLSYLFKIILYPQIDIALFFIIFIFIYEASIINVCNKALSGKNDFKSQFTSLLISRLYIVLMFLIGLYYTGINLNQLMLVVLSGFFLNMILISRAIGKNGIHFLFRSFSFSKLKPMVFAAIPLGLAVIFNFMYDKIDVLLISKLKDFNQVAYYNIGYGLYKSSSIGFSFLLVTGYTMVSSLSKDKNAVKEFFKDYARIIIIICILISILLFIFSGFIVNFLYTNRYADAVIVVKILAAGFIGMGLNNLTGITLNGMGFFKVVMYITLYGLILNVILNFLFIPVYGIIAASIITVATEYFIFFMQFYYLRKILIPERSEGPH